MIVVVDVGSGGCRGGGGGCGSVVVDGESERERAS